MSKFSLSLNAATAFATFGVILHTGAAARREFCIAFVAEVVNEGATVEQVADAAKVSVEYDTMDDAERALFRKQVQYSRAIANGWSKLGAENQRLFVGGGLPASSAEKIIKAKAKPTAAPAPAPETATAPEADTVKVSQPSGAEVITPAEMGVHFAKWIDGLEPSTKLSEGETAALETVLNALRDYRERCVEPVKLAA